MVSRSFEDAFTSNRFVAARMARFQLHAYERFPFNTTKPHLVIVGPAGHHHPLVVTANIKQTVRLLRGILWHWGVGGRWNPLQGSMGSPERLEPHIEPPTALTPQGYHLPQHQKDLHDP